MGKPEILGVQISETKNAKNFQLSLLLMGTKSYLKFRTTRGTPQKWKAPICLTELTDVDPSVQTHNL